MQLVRGIFFVLIFFDDRLRIQVQRIFLKIVEQYYIALIARLPPWLECVMSVENTFSFLTRWC